MDIVKGILKGNPKAMARAISMIEDRDDYAQKILKRIFHYSGRSLVIGITGAPGSGKSTLVDQLVNIFKHKQKKVGIIAVDPTSPFSGGAILGDRIRMMRHSMDKDVFIRSMATRGHLGGLSKASSEAITVLEAGGKDLILVETVGVGQDEVEVVKLADMILVILTPGTGDEIQAFKAGIMEIADIFVLNKADSPETEKVERQLKAMLDLGLNKEGIPPIIKTVATTGQNVDSLVKQIESFAVNQKEELKIARKKRLILWMLRDIIREKIDQLINQNIKESEFNDYVNQIYKREMDPYTLSEDLIRNLKDSSMTEKIHHIGIAVNDLKKSLNQWKKYFSLKNEEIEEIKERGVRVATLGFDKEPLIELLEAVGENSTIKKFIENNGEGIHHICFKTDNLDQKVKELKKKGIRFVQADAVSGAGGSRIIFIHPSHLNGVLIELKEDKE
jgi:LAO/AO transport system kinase